LKSLLDGVVGRHLYRNRAEARLLPWPGLKRLTADASGAYQVVASAVAKNRNYGARVHLDIYVWPDENSAEQRVANILLALAGSQMLNASVRHEDEDDGRRHYPMADAAHDFPRKRDNTEVASRPWIRGDQGRAKPEPATSQSSPETKATRLAGGSSLDGTAVRFPSSVVIPACRLFPEAQVVAGAAPAGTSPSPAPSHQCRT